MNACDDQKIISILLLTFSQLPLMYILTLDV
jgi:hypothetical protein